MAAIFFILVSPLASPPAFNYLIFSFSRKFSGNDGQFFGEITNAEDLTPDNVSLIKPLANKTDSSTVVPSSKISRAPTLTTAYSLRLTF